MMTPIYVVVLEGHSYCYFDDRPFDENSQTTGSKKEALALRDKLRLEHPNWTYEAHEITLGEKLP